MKEIGPTRRIHGILSETFAIYSEMPDELQELILNKAFTRENVTECLEKAPKHAATLDFMEWIEVVAVAAKLAALGLDAFKQFKRGMNHPQSKDSAVNAIKQHSDYRLLEQTHRSEQFLKAIGEELDKI